MTDTETITENTTSHLYTRRGWELENISSRVVGIVWVNYRKRWDGLAGNQDGSNYIKIIYYFTNTVNENDIINKLILILQDQMQCIKRVEWNAMERCFLFLFLKI